MAMNMEKANCPANMQPSWKVQVGIPGKTLFQVGPILTHYVVVEYCLLNSLHPIIQGIAD